MRSVVDRNVVMWRIPVLTVLYSFLNICEYDKTSGRKLGLCGVLTSVCPFSAAIATTKFGISIIYNTG